MKKYIIAAGTFLVVLGTAILLSMDTLPQETLFQYSRSNHETYITDYLSKRLDSLLHELHSICYPFYGNTYGPYEFLDSDAENYDVQYDEHGIGQRSANTHSALLYEGVKCIEDTSDVKISLSSDGIYTPYEKQGIEIDTIENFWQRKELGETAIPILDEENGYFLGYHSTGNNLLYIGFTRDIGAGKCYFGGNTLKLGSDTVIQANIPQDHKGTSYLVLKNEKTKEMFRLLGSETDNGWYGSIHMKSIPSAYYSIGIENASSEQITYRGIYGIHYLR